MTVVDLEAVRQSCPRCGAVVAEWDAHTAWHKSYGDTVTSIAAALTALQEGQDLLVEGGQALGDTVERLIGLVVGPDPGRNGHQHQRETTT